MEYTVQDWHSKCICGDCAEKLPELLQHYPELLPDYCFLSFSALNPFPATIYAMPLCCVAEMDPIHISA
jgi:hypothetical protein